jgi:hypothetical protein
LRAIYFLDGRYADRRKAITTALKKTIQRHAPKQARAARSAWILALTPELPESKFSDARSFPSDSPVLRAKTLPKQRP